MGNFIPIKGNDTNINNHPTSDGQLLFTTDSGKLFLDSNNKRIEITDFINLDKINPFPNDYTYFENKIYIQNNKLHLWDPINRTLNQIAKSENKIVYATIFTNDNSGVLSDFYSTNGTLNQEHGIYGIVKNYAGEIEVGTFVISEDTRTFGICKGKASDFNINQSNGYIVEIISDDTSFISQPNLTKEYYFSNNNNFYRNGSIKYPYNENDFSKFINNNNNVLSTGVNVNIYVGNNVSLNISILNELNLEIQNVNFIGINKQTCSVIIPNLGNENINDSSILTNVSFTNLTIDLENDLSSGILSISNCENLTFNDCLFKNIYKFRHCTGIFIQNCNSIDRNEKTNEIYFESCKNIEIKNSNNISKFTFKDEELEQNTDEYNEELNYSVDKPILLLKNVDCNEIKIDYKSLSKENKLILLSNVNINSTIDIKTVSFIKFTSGKLLKESTSTIKIITNSDKLDLGSFDYSNAANIFIDDDFKYNLQGLSTRQVYNDSVEYNINDVPEQNELFYRKQYKLNHQIDVDNLDDQYDEKLDTSKSLHSDLIKIDEQLKKNHDKIQTVNDTFEEFSNNLTDDYALKSYVGVKTVSGGTVDNPLKITSLQSDLPVVIRGGYLAFNNPSDNDNYSITIHCVTDSEPIIVLHTDVLYDAFDTGEPIEYVGDIVMLYNDIYGLYHYSIDAETGETTFTHNDNSNNESVLTANSILNMIKTVDGAGSGLDADKLDGYESDDFAKLNHSTSNFNSVKPGFWYVNSTVNAPHTSCSHWGCLVFRTGSAKGNSYLIQIASPRGTSDTDTSDNTLGLYYRKFYNGTWLSWNVLYDSSRNSSGINAEFLSGYTWDDLNIPTIIGASSPNNAIPIDDTYGTQESEHTPLLYVKSGYFKIGSGDTDFLVAPALITIEPYSQGRSDEVVLFDSADLVTVINYSGITTYKVRFSDYKSTEVATRINVTELNGYYGDEYTLKSEILDELKAVDGEGSGLDADLLDGKHAHQLAQYGTASGTLATVGNLTETSIGESQMYRFYDSSNLIGEGTDKYYGIMQIYYSASYYVRIAVSMSSGKVYRQTNGASSWSELTPHIPVLSTDPSNPSEGQMWILNSN